MSLHITTTEGIIYIRLFGVVTDDDISELANAVIRMEAESEITLPRVTNLSEAIRMELSFADLWNLAQRRRAAPPRNHIKSAIVASQPIQLGFARMFQTLNDHPMVTVAIFSDQETAVNWLRAPGMTPPPAPDKSAPTPPALVRVM